jgi:hypothetical protein
MKVQTVKINESADNNDGDNVGNDEEGDEDGDDYIDEEGMLDVAERCFYRIA